MSSETDVAPAGAAEKKEDAPAKPRRQARGNPTHPGTRAGADQKKTGHGAGGHAGEPPPTIRPKTKPRPSQSANAVKRVGHAEGEARSAQGGAALAPGSRSPRRSYRTSVQTGVLTVTPDMSFTGSHPPVPAADAGTASPAPAKAKPPSHRPSHRPPTTPAEIAGAAIAAGAAGAAGTAAAEAKVAAAPAAAAPPAPKLRPAGAPAPSAATIVAPGGIEAAGTPAPSKKEARRAGRVKLNLSYVAPLSVMKMSFLVAIALGIAFVVAVFILWEALNDREVFTQVDQMIRDLIGNNRPESLEILQYVERGRVMSGAAILAVAQVVALTLISTLLAVIYNIVAALVGGVHVTLRED